MLDHKHFVLEYYKNASEGIHIQKVHNSSEAKKVHAHEYFQIYYIEKGSLIHYVDDDSARLVVGDMFIIPPGVKHRISEDEETVFYSLSFMLDALPQNSSLAIDFLKNLQAKDYIRRKISLPADEVLKVEHIMAHIYKEFETKKIGYDEIVKAYIIVLASIFARIYYENSPDVLSYEDGKKFILYCMDYIDGHYYQEMTLESIVRLYAMSRTKFCKIFSEISGYSFNKYLNLCRIRKAIEYIKNGYKISAIYGLCGYNDFSTFYRNFVKVTGVSPAQYKQEKL